MKLAIFELFKEAGLEGSDFIYFHYLADRLESNKFIQWNRDFTGQIIALYDEGLAEV